MPITTTPTITMSTDPADRPEEIDPHTMKVEANLDDVSGELLGYAMDKLFDAGALDVYYVPIYMKKNRPAVILTVLCRVETLPAIRELIFRETTTLGLRYSPLTVHRLERRFRRVSTRWGTVRIKTGFYGGEVVQEAPEYEDCKQIAEANGVALKEVFAEVWRLIGT